GHPMIDAVLAARAAEPALPALPRKIELLMPVEAATYLDRPTPVNGLDAKFSAQYCACAAWTDGVVGPQQFDDHRVHRAAGAELMSRISLVKRDDLEISQAEVVVHHDAGVSSYRADHGTTTVATVEQLTPKFLGLVSPSIGEE